VTEGGSERRVYFLRCASDGTIKVGSTINQSRRQRELQSSNAGELVLLGTCPGGWARESAIKAELAEHRIRGEWFHPTQEVADVVARCLAEEYAEQVRGQVLGEVEMREERAAQPVVQTKQERDAETVAKALIDWAADMVEATGDLDDTATLADAMTSLTNWLVWAERGELPGSQRMRRDALVQQMVASGGRWDRKTKRLRGVRLR
jgi:hypothetical protein